MPYFEIDTDNNITVLDHAREDEYAQQFSTQHQLATLVRDWPISRLVEIWNSFAGVAPFDDLKSVSKFENRGIAADRIWRAAQRLLDSAEYQPETAADAAHVASPPAVAALSVREGEKAAKAASRAPKPKRVAKEKKVAAAQSGTGRDGSKLNQAITMLQRKHGATLQELMAGFSWQAHSVRGFISTLGSKRGYKVESFKTEAGERSYKIEG